MMKEEDKKVQSTWHDDPANWKWGIFYYNKADKRIFLPKRIASLGWTINFANPYSIIIILTLIVFMILFPYIVKIFSAY